MYIQPNEGTYLVYTVGTHLFQGEFIKRAHAERFIQEMKILCKN